MQYKPDIFDCTDVDQAKARILTSNEWMTSEQRWEKETEWLVYLIDNWFPVRSRTCLDHGCGLGRLARPLIRTKGWGVLGTDISPSMRQMALEYVSSDDFLACDPGALALLVRLGLKFDFAIAVWSLQHCLNVAEDVALIKAAVRPGGRIFIANAFPQSRLVPTDEGWFNDGVDLWRLIQEQFGLLRMDRFPRFLDPGDTPMAAWGVFERCAE